MVRERLLAIDVERRAVFLCERRDGHLVAVEGAVAVSEVVHMFHSPREGFSNSVAVARAYSMRSSQDSRLAFELCRAKSSVPSRASTETSRYLRHRLTTRFV